MKLLCTGLGLLLLAAPACRSPRAFPQTPGILLVRQQVCDLGDFKKGFFAPANHLKAQGFLSYRFYRDLGDPKTYILAFQCADLEKAMDLMKSSHFTFYCVGAGQWGAACDTRERGLLKGNQSKVDNGGLTPFSACAAKTVFAATMNKADINIPVNFFICNSPRSNQNQLG